MVAAASREAARADSLAGDIAAALAGDPSAVGSAAATSAVVSGAETTAEDFLAAPGVTDVGTTAAAIAAGTTGVDIMAAATMAADIAMDTGAAAVSFLGSDSMIRGFIRLLTTTMAGMDIRTLTRTRIPTRIPMIRTFTQIQITRTIRMAGMITSRRVL